MLEPMSAPVNALHWQGHSPYPRHAWPHQQSALRSTKINLSAIHHAPRRRLLTVTGVTGIAFTLSWIAGLSVPAPSPKLTASGTEITAALAGHGTAVASCPPSPRGRQPLGWPSFRSPWPGPRAGPGAAAAARFACIAGVAAAVTSLAQFVLGMVLAWDVRSRPGAPAL